jgi:hypothetical protein
MISIWRLENDSWEFVEEMEDDSTLITRMNDLRIDGNEYRAENRDGGFATVLGV